MVRQAIIYDDYFREGSVVLFSCLKVGMCGSKGSPVGPEISDTSENLMKESFLKNLCVVEVEQFFWEPSLKTVNKRWKRMVRLYIGRRLLTASLLGSLISMVTGNWKIRSSNLDTIFQGR